MEQGSQQHKSEGHEESTLPDEANVQSQDLIVQADEESDKLDELREKSRQSTFYAHQRDTQETQ